MLRGIELRTRDGRTVKTCAVRTELSGLMPDVVIDMDPAGVQTVYHQVSNGRVAVYVESIISLIGGQHEGSDRGEVSGEQEGPPSPV